MAKEPATLNQVRAVTLFLYIAIVVTAWALDHKIVQLEQRVQKIEHGEASR